MDKKIKPISGILLNGQLSLCDRFVTDACRQNNQTADWFIDTVNFSTNKVFCDIIQSVKQESSMPLSIFVLFYFNSWLLMEVNNHK